MSQELNTSITIAIFRHLSKRYKQIEQMSMDVYCNSQTYRLVKDFWKKTKICFGYSFLGKITEIRQIRPMLLDNSRTVQSLINFYKKKRDKLIHYLENSRWAELVEDAKRGLFFSFARMISLIVLIAILVNVVLSIILQRQIGVWAFLIRVLFLFAGTFGLSCQADWPAVKNSSVFFGKLWRQ